VSAAATPSSCAAIGGPGRSGDADFQIEHEPLIQQRIGDRHEEDDLQSRFRPCDAVEEAEQGPHRHSERAAEHARKPKGHRQVQGMRRDAERSEQLRASERQHQEKRRREQRSPQCRPGDLRGAHETPGAIGLRDEGLHRQADAAKKHDEHQHRPVNRADRRRRVRRHAPDEPGVGGIQNRLHRAVHHERKRQRADRKIIEAWAAAGTQSLAGQQVDGGVHEVQ
jgi:hypothetical protein